MNRLHYWYCNREAWKRHVREDLVPAALEGVELGSQALEVGPGFGPATEVLSQRAPSVTALEIDPVLAGSLRERLGARVIGDTKVVIDPSGLAERLVAAGFEDAVVHAGRDAFRFCAYAGFGKASSPAATASESRFSAGASGQAQREL